MNGLALVATTQYDQLVREGREARKQADNVQWAEGDLALQVEALPRDYQPRDPETGDFLRWDGESPLRRYAGDIDINYGTLRHYRTTAAAWPHARRRASASWGVHHALNTFEDRFALIRDDMTVSEARRIVTKRRASTSGKPGWHELIGRVGDALLDAEKHMGKVEAAITHEPDDSIIEKAEKYAEWADALALRLRALEETA